jgi:hypothetical protein
LCATEFSPAQVGKATTEAGFELAHWRGISAASAPRRVELARIRSAVAELVRKSRRRQQV